MDDARALIETLGLAPHPEGGWYRETWRGEPGRGEPGRGEPGRGEPGRRTTDADGRASGTAIHFLLEAGQRSHWHRIDAEEIWLWHAGSPLDLSVTADETAPPILHRLGAEVIAGEAPQIRIPAHHWQAAHAARGWALVSCIVVPGFDFAGFTLAPPGWTPGR